MIEKLKSHLRSKKGFTLIELLIVIAIIAILVLIVVVAINPAQRLRDASDRTASSNTRSAGTLIETCITQELAEQPTAGTLEGCAASAGDNGYAQYGNIPTTVTVVAGATAGDNDVCAAQQGSATNYYVFSHSTGRTVETAGTLPAAGTYCPGL